MWECRVCGNENEVGSSRCRNCWASRDDEVERPSGGNHSRRRRSFGWWRTLRWAVVLLVFTAFTVWYLLPRLGVAIFYVSPVSDISSEPVSGSWPMYQRDPTHSGSVTGSSAIPIGALNWKVDTGVPIYSSPAVVDGVVYATLGHGGVIALDEETGGTIWREQFEFDPMHSSPAVAGDMLFFGRPTGVVTALDRQTGEVRWEFETGERVSSSPAVVGGELFVGSGNGRLYALDAFTGRERWSYKTGDWISSSPAVLGDVVAIVSFDGLLHVVDRRTGKKRLDFYVSETPRGSAAFGERYLFIADGQGRLKAVDWRKRTLPLEWLWLRVRTQLFQWGITRTLPRQKGFVWGVSTGDGFHGAPVVHEGRVYAANFGGEVVAADEDSGVLLWTYDVGAPVVGSMSASGGTVFVGDTDGILHALDAASGMKRWDFHAADQIWATPVVSGGVLYLASWDGGIYAIK